MVAEPLISTETVVLSQIVNRCAFGVDLNYCEIGGIVSQSESLAWQNQSKTLIEVQRYGSSLEREVRNILDWDAGRIVYDKFNGYKIQVDCAWPSLHDPKVIASVTYSDPDTPGHSNENKLQLKLGELALLKNCYPELKAVLVLGGTQEAWLPYVLEAFKYFYDQVIFLWEETGVNQLGQLKSEPNSVVAKHQDFWDSLRSTWKQRQKHLSTGHIPSGLVRYAVLDALKSEPGRITPSEIVNPIASFCMQASLASGGTEWNHYRRENWGAIEMSRSYFNPQEAIVELSLLEGDFQYQGGVARDIEVPSLLHALGMKNTKLSEDFTLYSEVLGKPVYIQCKASGGGRAQHGKNIQNRTKEQVARGILYSANLDARGALKFNDSGFHWISVLDGNWGVNQGEQYKYLHMLELAGYKKYFEACSLLDDTMNVLPQDSNPLIAYLNELKCVKL